MSCETLIRFIVKFPSIIFHEHAQWSKRRCGNWINTFFVVVAEAEIVQCVCIKKIRIFVIYSWNDIQSDFRPLFRMDHDHDIGNKLWIMRFPRWGSFWIYKLKLSLFLFYYVERSRGCWYRWNSRYGHRRHKAVTFICKCYYPTIMLISYPLPLQSILSSSSCKRSEKDISVSYVK